jgi:hypothetical protein
MTTDEPILPGLAESFASVGVDALPLGVARLSRRERIFLLEYLRTGTATEAARRAGYSMPESNASKLLKNNGIAACLAQAGVEVAKNVDQLVMRASERSRVLHTMFRAEVEKSEEQRDEKRICQLAGIADRADMLLGSLLGKIGGMHVSGGVHHTHSHRGEIDLTVPAAALPVLAQMRRDEVTSPAPAIEITTRPCAACTDEKAA